MTNEEAIKDIEENILPIVGGKSLLMAIAALEGEDIDVPTNSALDHIHNVVRDDAYKRGYEQGKKDAAPKWIPVTPETMPPDDEEIEVTILDDSGDSPFRYTTVGWHYNGLWIANNERCFWVVAWKPLSEPWKGEE